MKHLIWLLGVGFLLCVSSSVVAQNTPVGLVGIRQSTNRADLFWFYPELNDTVFGHDDGTSETPIAVLTSDFENKAAVRFVIDKSPFFVNGISVFLINSDPYPSYPGDPNSPVMLSLHSDMDCSPGEMIGNSVSVQASGEWQDNGGEWLTAETPFLSELPDTLWAVVSWSSDNPCTPLLGGDASEISVNSFVGFQNSDDYCWTQFPNARLMIRLNTMLNTMDYPISTEGSDIDSFIIYTRDQPPLYTNSQFRDAATSGYVMHQRVDLPYFENYFYVTAYSGSNESPMSEAIMIEGTGSGAESAPVQVSPKTQTITGPVGEVMNAYTLMSNMGASTVSFEYMTDGIVDEKGRKLPLVIDGGFGSLDFADTDTLIFSFGTEQLEPGSYYEQGELRFWDSDNVYDPISLTVEFEVEEATDADEISILPEDYSVLRQNYPNPFNSETTIRFLSSHMIAESRLDIFDIRGRLINSICPVESHESELIFHWNGCDSKERECPTGIYFYRIHGNSGTAGKMLLLK